MKKVLTLVAATGIIAAASLASAASIVNSKHNLTSSAPAGGTIRGGAANTSQICVYCHAPHQATPYQVLWNRNNPAANTFTLYSGVGMNSRQFASGFTTDSTSLFCMSCHDGTTDMASIHNAGANIKANGTATGDRTGRALYSGTISTGGGRLGTNLASTHPVNFPVTTLDPTLNLGTNANGSRMGTGDAFPLFKSTAGGATGNTDAARTSTRSLECGSCHAVHDSAYSPFLRATLAGSAICLGCHNK